MSNFAASLGALRCATIVCRSLAAAVGAYQKGLGYRIIEEGVISAERAANWAALGCEGASYVVLGPPSQETTYIRFVEDPNACTPSPYTSLGWAALEFTVASSDKATESLRRAGFIVVGPPQDLAFSEGALRAGQVQGLSGEVLYLTQVNAQLDHYVLPQTGALADKLFIVILAVPAVEDAYRLYARDFGMIPKDPFQAEVPFIASFQGFAPDRSYHVGCLELTAKSYVEVDAMDPKFTGRSRPDGRLPPGISIITVETPSLQPFFEKAHGPVLTEAGTLYGACPSLLLSGPFGELIEVVEVGS